MFPPAEQISSAVASIYIVRFSHRIARPICKNIPTGANPMGCTIGRAGHHNRQCRGAKSRDRVSFSGAGHPCNVYCAGFAPDCKQLKAPAGEVSSQRGGKRKNGKEQRAGEYGGKNEENPQEAPVRHPRKEERRAATSLDYIIWFSHRGASGFCKKIPPGFCPSGMEDGKETCRCAYSADDTPSWSTDAGMPKTGGLSVPLFYGFRTAGQEGVTKIMQHFSRTGKYAEIRKMSRHRNAPGG